MSACQLNRLALGRIQSLTPLEAENVALLGVTEETLPQDRPVGLTNLMDKVCERLKPSALLWLLCSYKKKKKALS